MNIPFLSVLAVAGLGLAGVLGAEVPNVVLVMTDDQGWGETGYYGHPVLKTPNLDAMAENGLRFDRFYAGGPVCSPTRASVLTGRSPFRCGVPSHGYALHLQEKTLAVALKGAGYATGHFGKWHLNGLRGPGVPVLGDDDHSPGAFGFEEWLTVTNFFDRDPLMSRKGEFEEFKGDSSAIIVGEALKFMKRSVEAKKPFLAVIWDGSPHSPWVASAEDRKAFAGLSEGSQHHYGELAAVDRSVGTLRAGLREMGVAENTLLWFCSDNGGLPKVQPETVGGLRGFKGSVWEGGVRVPGIVEWPGVVKPGVTELPACTMDIFPTVAEVVGLPEEALLKPVDGMSLAEWLRGERPEKRGRAIGFLFQEAGACVDDELKLVCTDLKKGKFGLYDLAQDPREAENVAGERPEVLARMKKGFLAWKSAVEESVAGKDYPEGKVREGEPASRQWSDDPRYEKYFEEWKMRPEYEGVLRRK
ncbi:MAG: sulfatase-like hydrolase/transferase [Verrucomicrobia bacterium]|nr:sulfatase-like hydrolase/transferase [Verrucomicrobiota bacterium]